MTHRDEDEAPETSPEGLTIPAPPPKLRTLEQILESMEAEQARQGARLRALEEKMDLCLDYVGAKAQEKARELRESQLPLPLNGKGHAE